MRYLFGAAGLRKLETMLAGPVFLGFDFDGTLAPTTVYRQRARMRPPTKSLVHELISLAPVAVISGRAVKDLKRVLQITPHYILGNHGLEGIPAFRDDLTRAKVNCSIWKRSLQKTLGTCCSEIEDKKYSLTLHYRLCDDKEAAIQRVVRVSRKLKPKPRILLGDHVVNLTTKRSPNKGNALRYLMKSARCARAIYVGDDYTDEDIFKLKRKSIMSIRVGKSHRSKADWYLKDQKEIDRLLKYLSVQLRTK